MIAAALAVAVLGVLIAAACLLQLRGGSRAAREREAVMDGWAAALDRRYWELWRREMALLEAQQGGRA